MTEESSPYAPPSDTSVPLQYGGQVSPAAAVLLALATAGAAIVSFYATALIVFSQAGIAGLVLAPVAGIAVAVLTGGFVRQSLRKLLVR